MIKRNTAEVAYQFSPSAYSRIVVTGTTSGSVGVYRRFSGTLEAKFRKLVGQWQEDVRYASSLTTKFTHPAFLEIVDMGWPVVPYIIDELKSKPGFLCEALAMITGEDPLTDDLRGRVREMSAKWIEWYDESFEHRNYG